jgi:2-polyprenyl-6-methoxyphenol hydroxylase-like FAD-dependent oxidoreductase
LEKKISKEDRSIVIGGGIAGLLASRVLSEHFANVVLVEKDHYPENAGPRNGTPQANHVHVLLMKGKQLLTDLFPNLERNLLDKGAHKIDLLADARYLLKTGWAMSFDSGMYTIACARQLLEHTIRNEILTHYTNIEILEDTRVTGLVVGKNRREDGVNDRRTIVGITTVFQNTQRIIYGQLIVDASGETMRHQIGLKSWVLEDRRKRRLTLTLDMQLDNSDQDLRMIIQIGKL